MDFEKYIRWCPCGSKKVFDKCCKPKNLNNVIQSPDDAKRGVRPDWRIAVISQIAEDVPAAYPGGPSYKKGSYVSVVHQAKHPLYRSVSFRTPHATALSLSIAVKNASLATELKKKVTLIDTLTPEGKGKRIESDEMFFDYLEHIMVAVNFSFQALETFCNSVIARTEDLKTIEVKTKNGVKTLEKKEIERACSTEEKLLQVLPTILKLSKIKDTLHWQLFKKLKEIRDNIVHMKSRDMYSNINNDSNTLFFTLFDYHPLVFPKISFQLIWLYSQTSIPRHREPIWAQRFIDYLGKEIEKYY